MTSLREAAEADRRSLLVRLGRQDIADTIIGAGSGLKEVLRGVDQVARSDAPVLILGETGSGKEVIARAIHARSARHAGPFLRVNCGAIPSELADSELFGHERGSFTGASSQRQGWFERADGGTLFLDEIGELSPAVQVRLLRVLQDGTFERVGGQRSLRVAVRLVAATHRDLHAMVREGRFREDLWYRINVFPLRLPALRERPDDIPPMAIHFALRAAERLGLTPQLPSPVEMDRLIEYPWPGNVRELAAVIERAAILGEGRCLEIERALGVGSIVHPVPRAAGIEADPDQIAPLDQVMKAHIERTLAQTFGRIEGPFGAARRLAIHPDTLRARMRKLRIDWRRYRGVPGP
ncbi:sigma-54 dependent transcriptional regulator [Thioalkalicoccus limnaeus]|uniref:Sigma-54 dependent transcriptional regulator n=1 Tax=Thioalkalicoccus limnaeus TaxID=120681 RepID=A0ABV4BAF3_9GAMM